MHQLKVGPDWATQIDLIRNTHTDDTQLIRFGNNFYRQCRATSERFTIALSPALDLDDGPLHMELRAADFYVTDIGDGAMGRYSSLLGDTTVSAQSLDHSIRSLAKGGAVGSQRFMLQSMLTFCVAESLRNDHLATALSQTFMAAEGRLLGVRQTLTLAPWHRLAHQWGQASDAVHQFAHARGQASHTYVDLARLPESLQRCAATTRTLKRP